jgi:hypothetical protein
MATIKLKVGDDNTVKFTITDSAGTAINLTGGTIKFKIAKGLNTTDANAVYVASYTSFTDPTNGIHSEVIPDSISGLWSPGTNYKYQSRFIDSGGIVQSEDVDNCVLEQNLLDNE